MVPPGTFVADALPLALSDLVVNPASVADNLSAVKIGLSGSVTLTAEAHGAFTSRTVRFLSQPRYPEGVTLRFARVLRYREDKSPQEADTVESVVNFQP